MENRDEILKLIEEENYKDLILKWNNLSDEEKEKNKDLLIIIYKAIIGSNEFEDENKDAVLDMLIYNSYNNEKIVKMHLFEFIKTLTEITENEANSNFGMSKRESIISVIENSPNVDLISDSNFINNFIEYLISEYHGLDKNFILEGILDISLPNSIIYNEVIEKFLRENNSLVLNHHFFEKIEELPENYNSTINYEKIDDIDEFIRIDSLLEEDVSDKCKLQSFLKTLPILIKKSEELNIKSQSVLKYIERISFNDNCSWKNLKIKNKKEIENLLLKYVKNIIKKEENTISLIENRGIVYFIENVKRGNFEYIDPNVFENDFINIQIPNMANFDEFIDNGESIPYEIFDDFVNNIFKIKLVNERIPEKYYKYIIKEATYGYISKDDYGFIIQRALEDLAYDYLVKNEIEEYSFGFGNIDSDGYIEEDEQKIILSDVFFYNYNITETLDSIFHEITHAIQYMKKENLIGIDDVSIYNKSLYNMIKEDIILTNIENFYTENYENLECEFNARIQSAIKTNNFLLELGFSEKEIAILSNETIGDKIKRECNNNVDRNIKILDGKDKHINDILADVLNKHKDYIVLYPILKLEFKIDENGNIVKKDVKEIIEEYKAKLESINLAKVDNDKKENNFKNLNSLYREILGDDVFYSLGRKS